MTNWQRALTDATVKPTPELLAELSEALRSADPVVRDDQAYVLFRRWIPELSVQLRKSLGDEMAARFRDGAVQARTFAPLILTEIVRSGEYDPSWQEAFSRWYVDEADLRGHDPELGWLHAVAHGADLLGAFGLCAQVKPSELLNLACARLLRPTDQVFDSMEDDRLGFAISLVLTRTELTERQSVDWLAPITEVFEAAEPGPVPAFASNTMRTLRVLYLLADRGVRLPYDAGPPVQLRHAGAVREAVAAVLALNCPYAG